MGEASARRSLLLSLATRHGALALRLVSMTVLARLLTPEDYGAFFAAAALVGIVAGLSDLGVHQWIVAVPELTRDARRGGLGLGLAAGIIAFALVQAGYWIVPERAWSPPLRSALFVLSFALLLYPLATVGNAALQRDLRFGPLLWIGLTGAGTLAGVSVLASVLGMGAVGLAVGTVAEAAVTAALLHRVQPLARPSTHGWRAMLGAGWIWASIGGLRQAGDSVTHLLVGGALGLGAVGVLSRAQSVVQLFDKALMEGISPVVLPTVAERRRGGGDLGPVYLRQVALLAAVAWPFFALAALLAEPVVRLVLGNGWPDAVPAVRVLALAGLLLPLNGFVLPYLVALGVTGRYLPLQVSLQIGKILLVALGAWAGNSLVGICAALVAEAAFRAVLSQRLLASVLDGYRVGGLGRALGICALPTVLAVGAGGGAGLALAARGAPPVLVLAAAAAAAVLAWLPGLFLSGHPLADELRRVFAATAARIPGR